MSWQGPLQEIGEGLGAQRGCKRKSPAASPLGYGKARCMLIQLSHHDFCCSVS